MKLTAPESITALVFGFVFWALISSLMEKHITFNPFKTKKMAFIIPSCIVLVISFVYMIRYMLLIFDNIKCKNYFEAIFILLFSLPFIYIDVCFMKK